MKIYKYNDYEYKDEAGEFTTEEVKRQLTQYFPEIANCTVEEKQSGEDTVVTFVKRAGTKGAAWLHPAQAVRREPPTSDDVQHLIQIADGAERAGTLAVVDPGVLLSLCSGYVSQTEILAGVDQFLAMLVTYAHQLIATLDYSCDQWWVRVTGPETPPRIYADVYAKTLVEVYARAAREIQRAVDAGTLCAERSNDPA